MNSKKKPVGKSDPTKSKKRPAKVSGPQPAVPHNSTSRKQAEETLRESEERFRSILDNIEDGYYEVDTAGNLTFFNPALVRMLGRPAHELMGMNNRLYMTPEGVKAVFQTFNRVFRTVIPE
jgi:PAS domain-containing protein